MTFVVLWLLCGSLSVLWLMRRFPKLLAEVLEYPEGQEYRPRIRLVLSQIESVPGAGAWFLIALISGFPMLLLGAHTEVSWFIYKLRHTRIDKS